MSCSQGLRLHRKEHSDPRPELDKVWSLLRAWPLCSGLGGGVLGGGKAGGIWEPEAGRLQASNCLWMKMHWVGSRGAGRLFLEVTGSAQPRTHYWEGARKEPKWGWAPEACEWEPRFPDAPQLEVPNGPTLRKQPLHHGAHFPPSLPGNPFLYR